MLLHQAIFLVHFFISVLLIFGTLLNWRIQIGEVYNIGGHNEMRNIDIVKLICRELGKPESLIELVADRKGHDLRYAIDNANIQNTLGWQPEVAFEEGIKSTIRWYLENQAWWERLRDR